MADHVATVTLNRPETRNALSDDMHDDLLVALEKARCDDDDVRVVVLTSSHERIFSAGGDLKAIASEVPVIAKYAVLDRFPRLYQLIAGLGKPVACAANGDVPAGSFGLALACDFVLAKVRALRLPRDQRRRCPVHDLGADLPQPRPAQGQRTDE